MKIPLRRENRTDNLRERNEIELSERPEIHQEIVRNQFYLDDLHKNRNSFLKRKKGKIKKSISNIGVSCLFVILSYKVNTWMKHFKKFKTNLLYNTLKIHL